MSFQIYLEEAVVHDFIVGKLPKFWTRLMPDNCFMENQSLKAQGYWKTASKFDTKPDGTPHMVWYKKGHPTIYDNQVQPDHVFPMQRPGVGARNILWPQQQQAQQPQAEPEPAPIVPSAPWVLATVMSPEKGLTVGMKVAAQKSEGGMWEIRDPMGKSTVLAPNEVMQVIQSVKGADGKPIKGGTPEMLLQAYAIPAGEHPNKDKMIPEDRISEEQKKIDAEFGQILRTPGTSHMMLNALAGTGKTTMLKHLAWKYGDPSQKWLYLVFNTKNAVEGREKFPKWVTVQTTNAFLGNVLGNKENIIGGFPQTERIAQTKLRNPKARDDDNDKKISKTSVILDGPDFKKNFLAPIGLGDRSRDLAGYGKYAKSLTSLVNSLNYHFKEGVTTLTDLGKSLALDPRESTSLYKGMEHILSEWDIDTPMMEVKERIGKYKGAWGQDIPELLNKVLGYNFMQKDYKKEMIAAAMWLLERSMPHAHDQNFLFKGEQHNVKDKRDFNDDLWFAAIHAEEIHWPHYDVVLADEVQDFNEDQKIMLAKLHDSGAKIVAVGDPNQSIYRFRGADSNSFAKLHGMLKDLSGGKEIQHSLTSNYRSRPGIIDFANSRTHVNNLIAGKKVDDGNPGVVTDGDVKYDQAFGQLKNELDTQGKVKNTAFISRTNEPLVEAALRLMTQKIPFIIVGKDVAGDIKRHIGKILSMGLGRDATVGQLQEKMQTHLEDETDHYHGQARKKAYLKGLAETTNAINSSIDVFVQETQRPDSDVEDFKHWLGQRLGGLNVADNEKDLKTYNDKLERVNPVVLTTAHSSKGLEFERVYILRDDHFPHKKATRPADLVQEENARYVAYTRAQDELHILDLKGQPGYKEKD